MTDDLVRWVVIRSSHVENGVTRLGLHTTLCGRVASGVPVDDMPADVKTCETCLRILVKRQGQ